uniref:Uncharacterized protein n=1 Tax=Corethron hystrix TaxID=216773 RepID=A0A7S1FPJ0_9STRA|mmetsp:Transcript_20903/g.47450  ORF Transcript_20903/g.47450 Transcript_20903/m.47450 type:complete len:113 (+) Transcript_20903:132-470(+)
MLFFLMLIFIVFDNDGEEDAIGEAEDSIEEDRERRVVVLRFVGGNRGVHGFVEVRRGRPPSHLVQLPVPLRHHRRRSPFPPPPPPLRLPPLLSIDREAGPAVRARRRRRRRR